MEGIEIRAHKSPWNFGVDIILKHGNSVAKPINILFTECEEGLIIDPSVHIENKEAQVLIDDLWAAGYRPTEGTGSAGSLAATERHLADMRKLVFEDLYQKVEK